MYLEEKGYSGIDGRAGEAPTATGSWDLVPPEEREGTWTALLPPRERERLLSRQSRVDSRRGPSHIRRPLSNSDCVICLLEEVSGRQRRENGGGGVTKTDNREELNISRLPLAKGDPVQRPITIRRSYHLEIGGWTVAARKL